MTDNRAKVFDWRNMPEKAQQILGEDFWGEINKMIPRQGPFIDMYKTSKEVIVIVEMPGINTAEKISIKMKGLKLMVTGEIPWIYPVGPDELLQKERFTGGFKREITLPNDIDTNGSVAAQFKSGLVELHIPRLSSEDEKEIPIEFGQ
ncbi:MAG: Hsp20/alpha crystallin family protein [Caulobacteraceae bacterium]